MSLPDKVAEIRADLGWVRGEHYKIVWLAGGRSLDRSALLRTLADIEKGIFVDLGKALSTRLLEVPPPLRTVSVEECLADCMGASPGRVTCLDHLEILFDHALRINPVALLKQTSRHLLIVASWPGTVDSGDLVFGPPDHPAHQKFAQQDFESTIHLL